MKKLIILLITMFLVVGCVDYKVEMEIKEDKSVALDMNMDIDMLKFAKLMLADQDTADSFKEQLITESCTEECSSNSDSNCMATCISENDLQVDDLGEDDIKKYVKDYVSSEDFSEDSLFSEEDEKELKDKGYEVTAGLDEDNYVYNVHISRNFDNIDAISTDKEKTVNLEDLFNGDTNDIFFTKTSDGVYKANFIASSSEEDTTSDEGIDLDLDLNSLITFNYVVKLPNQVISSNASEVSSDKKTLTWNLANNSLDKINYEFKLDKDKTTLIDNIDNKTLLAYGLIGGGALVLVVSTLIYVVSNKKNKEVIP